MLSLCLAYLDNEEDEKLFEDIYYSYRKQMIALAISFLKNETDAEDAVSAVFLTVASKTWDVVKCIQSEIDLRNYLLKATKNKSLNMMSSKDRNHISLNSTPKLDLNDIPNLRDDTFAEILCEKIEYEEIVKAIKLLEDKYRDVLYYHFVMEFSVPETAKLLGRTVTTTKQQLVRGKKMLLKLLDIKGDENHVNEHSKIEKCF